uniref:Ubiquitin-like protease family profile domain-containing protein n=1 Tax=Romanomermis culicivorax TaxID=13658 RepID=A0A915J5L0_ROMCU
MSGGSSKDNVVISFHDVCLRESDCSLLNGHYWLNDNIISFCFEYFRQIKYAINLKSSARFCFVSPDVVQLCKFSDLSTMREIFRVLNQQNCELTFLPINDNESSVQSGGSHWSLLVYRETTKTFYHYDSMGEGTVNFHVARQMCDTIYMSMMPVDSQK